jgi:hypothetical protein
MRKGLWATMLVWGVALMCGVSSVHAGEVDLLIQKLVEKNVLSANEAQILLDDTRQEVAKQNAQAKNDAIPAWVQTIKMKGDLRLRFQSEDKDVSSQTRNRARIRYRLGIEAKPNAQFTVGAGLASGGTDARSTNETLDDAFQTDGINLDYAWGEYKPNTSLSMIGGKYHAKDKGYLWYTTDMMWDSDIMQEGASVHLDLNNVLMGDVFMNAGYWVLGESSSSQQDLGMAYGQAGIAYAIDAGLEEPLKLKLAGTFYSLRKDDANTIVAGGTNSNTLSSGKYAYDFEQIGAASAELVYNWPEETSSPIKMVGAFADYVMNPDPDQNNAGWAAGFKIGDKKVAAKKNWQLKYQYVRLGQDAWMDAFPDSDRYSGKANVKSHEMILDIGLSKNVTLGLDYYINDVLKGTSNKEKVFQADIVMKF